MVHGWNYYDLCRGNYGDVCFSPIKHGRKFEEKMNVLAEEQKRVFAPGITEIERKKRERQFLELYYQLRKEEENSFFGRMSLQTRKRLHKLVLSVIIIKNRLGGFSYELIDDKRQKTDRPIIFAVSHVGKFDIEIVSEAIKDHYYLLSGDYEHLQGILDAQFLAINGVFYFNEKVQEDRKDVVQRMIAHLQAGGNLMYFPEGTWNLSPHLPMLPCYWGIVEIAQKGNAIIVPVAADQYDKKFKINIGDNIDMRRYGNTKEEKTKAITELRDVLSTLKWEIWETEPVKRTELKEDEWKMYCDTRLNEWPYFSMEYIDTMIYKPKGVVQNEFAFAHLRYIPPSLQTSFLFNKRLKQN